jgi:competence protein ComEA
VLPPLPPEARTRRRAAAALLDTILTLALLHAAVAPAFARSSPDPLPPPLVIDLALDPAWRLELLPGVGPKRARALVEWRERHGAPRRTLDLLAVPGLGALGLKRLAEAPDVRVRVAGRPLTRPR